MRYLRTFLAVVSISGTSIPAIAGGGSTFSDPEGIAYANRLESTWKIRSKFDEMSDKKELSVFSHQSNGGTVRAEIVGKCDNEGVTFYATVLGLPGIGSLSLSNSVLADDQVPNDALFANLQDLINRVTGAVGFVRGELRVNSDPKLENIFLLTGYANRPIIAQLSLAGSSNNALGFGRRLDVHSTWRVLAKFDTNHGPIVLKIPVYDPAIEALIISCLDTPSKALGQDRSAYMGVNVSPVNNGTSKGALITAVSENGPAADAGLQPGDVITRVGDQEVSAPTSLQSFVKIAGPGKVITIAFVRNSRLETAEVRLTQRPP